jgi:uroporphyrin-III C-methyltransferase / precorrin-2 dehydrogenase / sirohydrochlorin ferrochelatase
MAGKVHIVGAGPGSADLLTVKAVSALRAADVVLHDDLVPAEIVQLAPQAAQIVNVGKRCGSRANSQEKINALMVWHAHNGSQVVRLKSGDPAVFGRLGEELDALRRAGIPFEVVPGVTAASAAASAAGITLTDRRAASTLVIATAHNCRHNPARLLAGNADLEHTTTAVYMPGPDYGQTARRLIQSGLDANTPCVLVSNAGRKAQQVCYMTISDLPFAIGIAAPAVLIIGEVARKKTRTPESSAIKSFLEEKYEPVSSRGKNPPYQ